MRHRHPKGTDRWKTDNENFLAEKAKEEGVTVLESGVIMKPLEKGHGTKCPTPSSVVYAHYTGKLIDGTIFDSSRGEALPALFIVRELIMGWQIALVRMHEGDRYEVTIPAKWGYGSMKTEGIPANSTLIFDLELIKIER